MILHFHPTASIMIASDVTLANENSDLHVLELAKDVGVALLSVLGKVVTRATGSSSGDLALTWSDGSVTRILNSWKQFESFTITFPDGFIAI